MIISSCAGARPLCIVSAVARDIAPVPMNLDAAGAHFRPGDYLACNNTFQSVVLAATAVLHFSRSCSALAGQNARSAGCVGSGTPNVNSAFIDRRDTTGDERGGAGKGQADSNQDQAAHAKRAARLTSEGRACCVGGYCPLDVFHRSWWTAPVCGLPLGHRLPIEPHDSAPPSTGAPLTCPTSSPAGANSVRLIGQG
jgi:hypothetical protein